MRETIRRELRVAFSRRAQPAWFRVSKWIVLGALTFAFWRKPAYWRTLCAILPLALFLHLVYRHKTRCWTQPWGGWNDLDAAK
jgi:hypothetical protein